MPSALDLRLETAYNLITGPGGPIQVGSVERFGRQLPFIANAPTNLADYVAFFAAQHGDATFLVEGDERLSFKQVYAAARKVAAGLIDGIGQFVLVDFGNHVERGHGGVRKRGRCAKFSRTGGR